MRVRIKDLSTESIQVATCRCLTAEAYGECSSWAVVGPDGVVLKQGGMHGSKRPDRKGIR